MCNQGIFAKYDMAIMVHMYNSNWIMPKLKAVDEFIYEFEGKEHHCVFDGIETILQPDGKFCASPVTHHVTLCEIVDLLTLFSKQPDTLVMPEIQMCIRDRSYCMSMYKYRKKDFILFENIDVTVNNLTTVSYTHLLRSGCFHLVLCGITLDYSSGQ